MPEFDTDTLLPPKHGVMTPFAKFAWALIILLVLVVTWAGMNKFKPERFRSSNAFVESARHAIHSKDWEQAARDLANARKLAPDNPKVTQAIIELLKITGADAAGLLQMIQTLNQQAALSPELQLLMARTLFRLGRFSEAREWHGRLPETLKAQTEALELMAGLLSAEGRAHEAAEFMRRSLVAMPDCPVKEFRLAMEDVRHPFASISQKARQALWRIAQSNGEFAFQAISQLSLLSDLTINESNNLLKLLDEKPDKEAFPVRLELISAMVHLQPDKRDALCADEVTRFRQRAAPGVIPVPPKPPLNEHAQLNLQSVHPGKRMEKEAVPAEVAIKASEPVLDNDLRVFCRWLAKEKQPELLQQLVPLKIIQSSSELFTCLALAMSEDQQWSKLQVLLAGPKPAVNPILISIWHAVVEGHLQPDNNESIKLLFGAIEGAAKSKDSVLLLAVALAAEQFNEQGIALSAYQAIATFDEKKAVVTLEQAYAKAELLKDTTAMLNSASKLHVLRPDNRAYAERLAYLQLLCGRDFEVACLESGHTEGRTGTETASLELLQALAAYRLSDTESMKQHLQRIAQSEGLSVGQRAAFAGLLSKAGQTTRAFQVAEKVPASLLLPEELTLLRTAL